jgi:hypothetical protein
MLSFGRPKRFAWVGATCNEGGFHHIGEVLHVRVIYRVGEVHLPGERPRQAEGPYVRRWASTPPSRALFGHPHVRPSHTDFTEKIVCLRSRVHSILCYPFTSSAVFFISLVISSCLIPYFITFAVFFPHFFRLIVFSLLYLFLDVLPSPLPPLLFNSFSQPACPSS